jgi:hypothetical protein
MLLIIFGALALRLTLTLTHDGYLGVDGGAYLVGMAATLGNDSTGAGFPRPPLAPGILLWPFVELLGVDIGYKVWSALASMAPILPVYLLAKRLVVPRHRKLVVAFTVAILSLDLLHAEMIVTGALPLLAFGFLGLAWWAMGLLAERFTWRDTLVLTTSLAIIPFINQTAAGLAIVTIPIYLLALCWSHREWEPIKNNIVAMAAGGLAALTALPWYLDVLPVTGMLRYPGPFIFITHPFDSAWWQFLLAWPVGLYVIKQAREEWLKATGVLVCLLGTLLIFLSTDETVINVFYRSRYLLCIPFYICVAWIIGAKVLPTLKWPMYAPAMALAAVGIMGFGYVWQFNNQAQYSAMATPTTTAALHQIREYKDNQAIISNSFTLSLWVAALNKVPSPHTWTWHPPKRFVENDKAVRCLMGWVNNCEPRKAQRQLNAGYILIDQRFPFYNSRAPGIYLAPNGVDLWENTGKTPWLTEIYRKGTTLVWRIELPPVTS